MMRRPCFTPVPADKLIAAHDGLDESGSHALNARLVLLLANHVGSLAVLREALAAARAAAHQAEKAST